MGLIQCTSPFVRVEHLNEALAKITAGSCDSVFSVTRSHSLRWMQVDDDDGKERTTLYRAFFFLLLLLQFPMQMRPRSPRSFHLCAFALIPPQFANFPFLCFFYVGATNTAGEIRAVNFDPHCRPKRQDWEGDLVENGAFYFATVQLLRQGLIQGGK